MNSRHATEIIHTFFFFFKGEPGKTGEQGLTVSTLPVC